MARNQPSVATRLPLAKFSFTTTTVNSHARMIWTHIDGDGSLFCETESHAKDGMKPTSFFIKVVQNNSVLVTSEVEITYLATVLTETSGTN